MFELTPSELRDLKSKVLISNVSNNSRRGATKAVGFEGEVVFDASKPDGTMRKLIDVSKLHSLGWTHKVEIDEGVSKLFQWYQQSLS